MDNLYHSSNLPSCISYCDIGFTQFEVLLKCVEYIYIYIQKLSLHLFFCSQLHKSVLFIHLIKYGLFREIVKLSQNRKYSVFKKNIFLSWDHNRTNFVWTTFPWLTLYIHNPIYIYTYIFIYIYIYTHTYTYRPMYIGGVCTWMRMQTKKFQYYKYN